MGICGNKTNIYQSWFLIGMLNMVGVSYFNTILIETSRFYASTFDYEEPIAWKASAKMRSLKEEAGFMGERDELFLFKILIGTLLLSLQGFLFLMSWVQGLVIFDSHHVCSSIKWLFD